VVRQLLPSAKMLAKSVVSPRTKAAKSWLRVQSRTRDACLACCPSPLRAHARPCFFSSRVDLSRFKRPRNPDDAYVASNRTLTEISRIDNTIDCTTIMSSTYHTQDLQTTTVGFIKAT
jgi:hypothetical protein